MKSILVVFVLLNPLYVLAEKQDFKIPTNLPSGPQIEVNGKLLNVEQAIRLKRVTAAYSENDKYYELTLANGETEKFTNQEMSSGSVFRFLFPSSVRVDFVFEKTQPKSSLYLNSAGPVDKCETDAKGNGKCFTYTMGENKPKEIRLQNKKNESIKVDVEINSQSRFTCKETKNFNCAKS